MAAELVNAATSEKLKEINWTKSIEICELVACDQGQARDVIKALKRRLETKNPNAQLFSVMLLEMLMNNCGEYVHGQVIGVGLLPALVKIVKKKSDLPVRKKIFLLLDATQASLGGPSGKFPQYHAAYHELVSAGVQFPQRPSAPPSDIPVPKGDTNSPGEKSISMKSEKVSKQSVSQNVPESSILQKASSAMEVLKEVLDAMNPQHPEGAKDEFTLDLVEQCSFEKQRVMHLVLTSRDDKLVSQAIEVNEQLQKVLAKHDALLSVHAATSVASFDNEEAEEEEEEQLFRRIQKGKACAKDMSESSPSSLRPVLGKMLHQPLIRPVHLDPVESNAPSLPTSTSPSSLRPVPGKMLQQPLTRPVNLDPVESNAPSLPTSTSPSSLRPVPGKMLHQPLIRPVHLDPVESNAPSLPTSIPPPPAKPRERERFFKEKQLEATATALPSQMGSLSLDRRNGNSSRSGSTYPSK